MTGQAIEETSRNKFRVESAQFQKQMKTTLLMETEIEDDHYIDENLKDILQASG